MPSPSRAACAVLLASALALYACSSDNPAAADLSSSGTSGGSSTGTSGTDTSSSGTSSGSTGTTTDGGVSEGGAEGGAEGGTSLCAAAVMTSSASFKARTQTGAAPDAFGGVIADGAYALTDRAKYNEPAIDQYTGNDRQAGLVISGNGTTMQRRVVEGSSDDTSAGSFTASGSDLVLHGICPVAGSTTTYKYSAQGGNFTLYLPDDFIEFYSKQ